MPATLELDDFFLTKLHVDWLSKDDLLPAELATEDVDIEQEVVCRSAERHVYALKLRVRLRPSVKRGKAAYAVDAEVVGMFRVTGEMPEDVMRDLVRTNGGTILYGILRGQIATFTGTFLAGKFALPTVSMTEVVARNEGVPASAVRSRKRGRKTTAWDPKNN